jgi:endo-1,4-beta-xylanase
MIIRTLTLCLCLISVSSADTAVPKSVILEMKSASEWKLGGNSLGATATELTAENRLQIDVPKAGEKTWDAVLHSAPITGTIHKGDRILIEFPVRHGKEMSTPGGYGLYLEDAAYKGAFQTIRETNSNEVIVRDHFVADKDYEAGSLKCALHVARVAQRLIIGPIKITAYAETTPIETLPVTPLTYDGRELDAPWRAAAADRIRKHRMSDVTVHVVGKDGQSIADAQVTWNQTKNAFGFGSCYESSMWKQDEDGKKYAQQFESLFNYGTVMGYLADWGWPDPVNVQRSIEIADWLRDRNMDTRGHLLVYPGYAATPRSWAELPGAERRSRLEAHIPNMLQKLMPHGVHEYDVVNELRDNIGFCDELGGTSGLDTAAEWFKQARQVAPDAKLYINEYWILAGGGYTNERERKLYADTIQTLLDKGAPIDGIGMQGHFGAQLTAPSRLIEILDDFAKFNKRIRVTEFDIDISDEEAQADYVRDFVYAMYSHPQVDGVVMWGFWEGIQWKPRGAMLRKDWSPKPSYHAFHKLVHETLASHHAGKTDSKGNWEESIHHGQHNITIQHGNSSVTKVIEVTNQPQTVTIELK